MIDADDFPLSLQDSGISLGMLFRSEQAVHGNFPIRRGSVWIRYFEIAPGAIFLRPLTRARFTAWTSRPAGGRFR
jgi:hypothetical protein